MYNIVRILYKMLVLLVHFPLMCEKTVQLWASNKGIDNHYHFYLPYCTYCTIKCMRLQCIVQKCTTMRFEQGNSESLPDRVWVCHPTCLAYKEWTQQCTINCTSTTIHCTKITKSGKALFHYCICIVDCTQLTINCTKNVQPWDSNKGTVNSIAGGPPNVVNCTKLTINWT
jgi:hypothetical protein